MNINKQLFCNLCPHYLHRYLYYYYEKDP